MAHLTFIAGAMLAPMFMGMGLSGATAGILSSVVGFVLAAGFAVVAALLAPPPPKPDDVKTPVQQTTPPRNFIYGRARTSGYFMLKVGLADDALYEVVALASHRVNEILFFYYNDDQLDLGMFTDRSASDPRFLYGGEFAPGDHGYPEWDGRYGDDRVFMDWRYGLLDGVEDVTPYFFSLNPIVVPFFPTSCIGKGICSLGIYARDAGADEQAKRFPSGIIEPGAVIEGYLLYDPRDPSQLPSDPDTWNYSINPVLMMIHWLCFSEFGYGRDYADAILPLEDEWKIQADICDELVPTWSGTPGVPGAGVRRYEGGGTGTTDNDQKEILAQMLLTCDGWMAERGDGVFVLRVGKWQPSGITLDHLDIKGFSYQRGIPDEDAINRMNITFTHPQNDYSEVECDPWWDEDDMDARGVLREAKYPLEWVHDYRVARRLAKREFHRTKEPVRGSLELRLSGINAAYERFVYLGDTHIPGLANRYVENRQCRVDLQSQSIHMEFWGVDETIDTEWDATIEDPGEPGTSRDEGVAPTIYQKIVDQAQGPEQVLIIQAMLEAFQVGDTNAQRIVVDFAKPADEFIVQSRRTYRIRWRTIDDDPDTAGDQPGAWTDETHNEDPIEVTSTILRLKTGAVEANAALEVEMATVSSGGTVGPWSDPHVVISSGTGTYDTLTDDAGNTLKDDTARTLKVPA